MQNFQNFREFSQKSEISKYFCILQKIPEIFRNSYFLRIRRLILRPRAKRYYIKRNFNHFWYFFARTHFFRKKSQKCSKDHFFAKKSTFSLQNVKRAKIWSFWALGGKSCEDSKRSIVSKQKRQLQIDVFLCATHFSTKNENLQYFLYFRKIPDFP